MSDYILITNFWNENGNLKPVIENVAQQVKPPREWFFIDDGSPVESVTRAFTEITAAGLRARIKTRYLYAHPPKDVGDKYNIGKAWNQTLSLLKELKADYVGILDVDARLPPHYFEFLAAHLDAHPEVGIVAGSVKDERRHRHMPMGGGKFVRWEIFEGIDEFWRLAPNSFFNIKSLAMGFENDVLDIEFDARLSTPRTGRDLGYRLYYTGNSVITALFKTMQHRDLGVIKGFLESRGAEQCNDQDVRDYYSKRRILKSLFTRKVFIL